MWQSTNILERLATLRTQNFTRKKIQSRLNSGIACYHVVRQLVLFVVFEFVIYLQFIYR
jgi:hypothetical protein